MGVEGELAEWLGVAATQGASDLHVVSGFRPTMRRHGELCEISDREITRESAHDLLMPACPSRARLQLEEQFNTDFALQLEIDGGVRRFRANYFMHQQSLGACFRVISGKIPEFEWSGFPLELGQTLAHLRNGLVLISGVTGAGKTTTLAMIINLLNEETGYRIITVEEPIEYLFPSRANSIVTQREVGRDVQSFADGLKYGLRQDPDVILVGEIRDRETAQMALSAAETGHLVFSTLHTRDAKGAISRYVDFFPQSVQNEIRSQLSMSLRAVVSQHLLRSSDPNGKQELALEIMFNNAPIASAIRLGKIESIETNIQTGRADGMITLDESIKRLLDNGQITRETAERFVSDRNYLNR